MGAPVNQPTVRASSGTSIVPSGARPRSVTDTDTSSAGIVRRVGGDAGSNTPRVRAPDADGAATEDGIAEDGVVKDGVTDDGAPESPQAATVNSRTTATRPRIIAAGRTCGAA
ncbi:hypothetical protein Acsp01_42450 [Actinoplanes sp. NBRC 101535]|nr:hypothetical protein Acsp01_42450 [Actinoplanes sp. NBRC 101535]